MKAQVLLRHREAAIDAQFGDPLPGCGRAKWIIDWLETGNHQGPVMPDALLRTAQALADAELTRDVRALRLSMPESSVALIAEIAGLAEITPELRAAWLADDPTDADLAALLLGGSEWQP